MRLRTILIISLVVLLAACQGSGDGANDGGAGDDGVFRPPTQVVDITPMALPTLDPGSQTETETRPTSTPRCTDNLWFLQDLTIPDGTLVSPGEQLDKRWLVENSGTCNWDESYEIRLVAGPSLGVPVTQALYPALSGVEVTIRMDFTAPQEPGAYRSAWQAYNAQGEPFGDPFFIDVVVTQ